MLDPVGILHIGAPQAPEHKLILEKHVLPARKGRLLKTKWSILDLPISNEQAYFRPDFLVVIYTETGLQQHRVFFCLTAGF